MRLVFASVYWQVDCGAINRVAGATVTDVDMSAILHRREQAMCQQYK